MSEFWRDAKMDLMINDIIEIFTKIEGVELVRLSGLTKRARKILKNDSLTPENIYNILEKLKTAGIINYKFITVCPHCEEISYQLFEYDVSKPKFCDSCKGMYNLVDGTTLKRS